MIPPARRLGPPMSQSTIRRNAHRGSSVTSGNLRNSNSAANHAGLPAYGLPTVSAANAANSISRQATTTFSGHASFIRWVALVGGAALITLATFLASPVHAQVTFPYVGSAATQTGGTIAVGGTFQTISADNPNRKGCLIQNTSARVMDVYFGALADATAAKSIQLAASGGSLSCSYGPIVITSAINITTTNAGDTYVLVTF